MKILTKEAREIKKEIADVVLNSLPFLCANLNNGLKVTIQIHENWFTKKGDVARKDVANREKFLVDSVFEFLGIDDKYIFELTIKKIQSDEEFSIINISELGSKAS